MFFVFLLLEMVSFWLIVRNSEFHQSSVFNSSNNVVAVLYDWNNSVAEYFKLKQINNDLAEENASLRNHLAQSQYPIGVNSRQISDTLLEQQYTYVASRVVNNSVNRRNNYLTINRGYLHGIESEMAVVTSQGVVGIVKDVSENYASVISILHKNSSISARIAENGYFGSVVWDGRNPQIVQLADIPNHVKLREGMVIETSGYSSMFPKGIRIGRIKSFEIGSGENFYSINVKLNVDMNAVNVVYVVKNLKHIEQQVLETESQENE